MRNSLHRRLDTIDMLERQSRSTNTQKRTWRQVLRDDPAAWEQCLGALMPTREFARTVFNEPQAPDCANDPTQKGNAMTKPSKTKGNAGADSPDLIAREAVAIDLHKRKSPMLADIATLGGLATLDGGKI